MTEIERVALEMEAIAEFLVRGFSARDPAHDLRRLATRLRSITADQERAFKAGIDAAAELWTELPIEWTADTRDQYQAKVDAAVEAYLTAEQKEPTA